MTIREFTEPEELNGLTLHPALGAVGVATAKDLHADRYCVALDAQGRVVARCSLWWTRVPALDGRRLGLIGQYGAASDAAASALLEHVCRRLKERGCAQAAGPMDGSTWRSYRFVTERGGEPPFFLEPDNPDAYPLQWRAAGFAPLAEYTSALTIDLANDDPRLPNVAARMERLGVTLRPLRAEAIDDELRAAYRLSSVSFMPNFLYAPIQEAEFLAFYAPLKPLITPEFVLLAERESELVGYLFATPDYARQQRCEPLDTLIVKTAAILPSRDYAGLGSLLLQRVQRAARERGYTRAIHALMHESNKSRNNSGRAAAETIRRYALFARPL